MTEYRSGLIKFIAAAQMSVWIVAGCASGLNLPTPVVLQAFSGPAAVTAREQGQIRSSEAAQHHAVYSRELRVDLLGYDEQVEAGPGQRAVIEAAYSLVGAHRLEVEGRRYPLDCSGTILAVYHMAGIDLMPFFERSSGNGVARLHEIAMTQDVLLAMPDLGDIVFWDNTYDRSRSGAWDDELTHAGIVVGVYADGGVDYLHYHHRKGIVIEHMNLSQPDIHVREEGGREIIVNSPMRLRRDRYVRPDAWLASHLYRETGALHVLASAASM